MRGTAASGTAERGGAEIICPPAADFDRTGSVNISDAIAILKHLFAGAGPSVLTADVYCEDR